METLKEMAILCGPYWAIAGAILTIKLAAVIFRWKKVSDAFRF